jgi:hypothetical protein
VTDNLARKPSAFVGNAAVSFEPAATDASPVAADQILHLAELVPIVRQRLAIEDAFPDDAILAALRVIANKSHVRARWKAAFNSNLGHWLALKRNDLHTALETVINLLPPPRS